MAEVGGAQPRSHGKGKKKKSKRIGVRLDMTPMVDVAFLLLTFFMLTTAFRLPQTLEISIPEDNKGPDVKIAESNILQIRVDEDNNIYWNQGNAKPQKTDIKSIRALIIETSEKNIAQGKGETTKDKFKLVTLIKIAKKAKYEHMINLVDELDLAILALNEKNKFTEVTDKLSPRFAFAPFTDQDLKEVLKAQ